MAYVITEYCAACGECQIGCPTRAIAEDEKTGYRIKPELCNECGVCVAQCPVDAIVSEDGSPVW